MTDLVVTIPRESWGKWIAGATEGCEELGNVLSDFCGIGSHSFRSADRLYIVSHDRLRGFMPETKVEYVDGAWTISWTGGFQAVTVGAQHSRPARREHTDLAYIRGFHGLLERWWSRVDEFGFPDWQHRDLWLNRAEGRKAQPIAEQGYQGGLFDG